MSDDTDNAADEKLAESRILVVDDNAQNLELLVAYLDSTGCEVSGPEQVAEMVAGLERAGKEVTGSARVDFACNAGLVALTLTQRLREVAAADGILVMSCGVGVQTVADAVEMQIHPATNSIYLGGFQGLWRSNQRCTECGECLLEYTGGICPLTACSRAPTAATTSRRFWAASTSSEKCSTRRRSGIRPPSSLAPTTPRTRQGFSA